MTEPLKRFTISAPAVDRSEILRYAGAKSTTPELDELLNEALAELLPKLRYDVCFRELPVSLTEQTVKIADTTVASADLAKNLRGCTHVILFAATVGIAPDRLVARYNYLSSARALLMQAIGTERIESLCDVFNDAMRDQYATGGVRLHPRFSPGYGDLPLSFQRYLFSILDCPRQIGLTLNESLLMSPTKSVTAIIGIEQEQL